MNRRQALSALAATATMTPVSSYAKTRPPVVVTTLGPVSGQVVGGVSRFLGVRYGMAKRFMPPVAPAPVKDMVAADRYGAACPQSRSDEPQSEDCLFLNVWTPEASRRKARPVMVYIHGGAYSSGSGSDALYDGSNLATRGDVVVVTLNHRLNVFGYLYLARIEKALGGSSLAFSGNAGQMDLHLALAWVRDNISGFGGDPGCVLVFGQSGGGAKIATLMATPAAKGLFHRAATMSGQQVTASGPGNATLRSLAFLKTLGLDPDTDGLAKVQALPAGDLVAALKTADPVIGSGGVYMGPVLDEAVLFRHPFYPDAAPQGLSIPMMIGNTHDETRNFLGNDPRNFALTWDELPAKLPKDYRVDIDPWLVIDTYRRLYPDMSPSEVFFAATTAGRSWRGAVIEDEERARAGAPAYAYQLDFRSPADAKYGAPHTLDIPLVFRNTAVPYVYMKDTPDARAMADILADAFIAFARTGSPQTPALPQWTPYSLDKRETMIMDVTPKLAFDPRGEERKLFEKVPFIQSGT